MPIKVMCPTCSQEGSVRDDFKGDAITCPSCRMRFDVKQWTVPALSERRGITPDAPRDAQPVALDTPEAILRFRIQQVIFGVVFGGFLGLLTSLEPSGGSSSLRTLCYTLAGAAFVGMLTFVLPHQRGGRSSGGGGGGWADSGDGGGGGGGADGGG